MSRSIHTTRRTFARLRARKFSTPEARLDALKKARRQLARKRLAKRQVRSERKRSPPPLAGTAVATILVEVLDQGRFVHYPAAPSDVRAILELLPDGATEGISRIQMLLGERYLEERKN